MLTKLRWRAVALTTRLIVGYTLAAALVLSAGAFFLYRGLEKGFILEDTELLSDQIEQVRGLVGLGNVHLPEVKQFVLSAAGVRDLEKYYGRLIDEHGAIIVETPGVETVAPPTANFPTPIPAGENLKHVNFWHGPRGEYALLAAAEVRSPDNTERWIFQIALNAEHVAEWLGDYRERLFWMVSGGTLGMTLLGWFTTWQGLRPLREVTDAIRDVTAHNSRGRLDAQNWPAELAALAREFDDMLARLSRSFERLAQFSADVAHEFRTPLNNLMGATSLALSQPRSKEEYQAALEASLEQYDRFKRMVESLLFIARADNAEATLTKRACAAGEIAREVCDFFSALAEDRGIALACEGSGAVHADEVLLRLALTNLVSNALRHTPLGGSVKINIQSLQRGFEITVQDTGLGIPNEHHARLFDRFYQVDASRSNSERGTGLGLAIVKSVMSLHGGSVTIASSPGHGSAFCLHFPAEPVE